MRAYDKLRTIKDYLYEVEYSMLDYDFAESHFEDEFAEDGFECTSIANGTIVGRNYDWKYSECPTFVIKVKGDNGRYASLGVVGAVDGLTNESVKQREYNADAYKILPFRTVDGVNEHGLYINVNVAPSDERHSTTGTIPAIEERKRLCTSMLVRFVLDNFKEPLDAIHYIRDYVSVYTNKGLSDIGYEAHFMLSKGGITYVMEFVDNKVVYKMHNVMTNFHINGTLFNEDGKVYCPSNMTESKDAVKSNHISPHGAGLERYNIAVDGASDADTVEKMRELMKGLFYTNAYKGAGWHSEFVGRIEGDDFDYRTDTPASTYESRKIEQYDKTIIELAEYLYENRSRETGLTWQTIHSSIYDLDRLELSVCVQEDEDEHKFSLIKKENKMFDNFPQPEGYVPHNACGCHCDDTQELAIGTTNDFAFTAGIDGDLVEDIEWIFKQGVYLTISKTLRDDEIDLIQDGGVLHVATTLYPFESERFRNNHDTRMQLIFHLKNGQVDCSEIMKIKIANTLSDGGIN